MPVGIGGGTQCDHSLCPTRSKLSGEEIVLVLVVMKLVGPNLPVKALVRVRGFIE